MIPRAVDDYWKSVAEYAAQPVEQRLGNPVHHIHDGAVPTSVPPVSFGLLLNLVGALGTGASEEQVRGYLARYLPAGGADDPALLALVPFAIAYHAHAVAPTLARRAPELHEADALRSLDEGLAALAEDAAAEDIQTLVYDVGKATFGPDRLRDWFRVLYETLLGTSQGPRMGSFIALYGVANTRALIVEALA